jgi:hypothetical protein
MAFTDRFRCRVLCATKPLGVGLSSIAPPGGGKPTKDLHDDPHLHFVDPTRSRRAWSAPPAGSPGPEEGVWNSIGYDIEQSCREPGVRLTNISAHETICDCERLEEFCISEDEQIAVREFRKLLQPGWDNFLTSLR